MTKLGGKLRVEADAVTNWYASKTRGASFADYANQRKIAIEAYEKKKNIAEWIRQGRLGALRNLEELPKGERAEAARVVHNIMQELKTESIRRRNDLFKARGIEDGTAEANLVTKEINDAVEREILPGLLEKQGEQIGKTVKSWADHNERVVGRLNKMYFKLPSGKPGVDGKGIVGLRFHIDDVYRKKGFEQTGDAVLDWQIHKAKKLSRSGLIEDRNLSYAVYAEEFSKNFLDDVERQAMKLVGEYKNAPVSTGMKIFEKPLRGLDKLTNFVKAQQLYFSLSWLKNNYWDNAAKAWVENGMVGLADVATVGRFQKGLRKDMMSLFKGNADHVYTTPDFMDALEFGVLDNPMFKSMTNEITREFLFRPDEIAEATDKTFGNWVKKFPELFTQKNPMVNLTQSVGSYMEGTARLMTYRRALEAMKKSKSMAGVSEQSMKEMAADLVKKTFFDYGDVTALEAATLKRIIPFYSFYSKNLPYWMRAVFDPERVGRVVALEKVAGNIGDDPSGYDKGGLSPFIADSNPRKMGKNAHGDDQYLIVPSSSQHDAYKMLDPSGWLDQVVEKGTPIPKAIYELASGEDVFTGDKLYPKDQKDGKKFLFSRGFKWVAARNLLEAAGSDPDGVFRQVAQSSGVQVDASGNPYTTSGWVIVLDKVLSTLLPHGAIDQVAGSVGKMKVGKETMAEAAINRLTPMMKVKVSPGFARMVRARKAAEKKGKRGGKEDAR